MSEDDKKVEIVYEGKGSDELNAQLDAIAEMSGGQFVSSEEGMIGEEYLCSRVYYFEDDSERDDFHEMAHLAVSKYCKMEFLTPEQLGKEIYWSGAQAVYHHAGFESEDDALRFGTMLRATLSAYLDIDMYDVLLLKDESNEEVQYIVIWAFPNESVIDIVGDDDDGLESDDFMKYLDKTRPTKKEDLN